MQTIDPDRTLAEQSELVRATAVQIGDTITRWDGHGPVAVVVTGRSFLNSGHLALDTTGGLVLFGAGGHARRLARA